MNDAKAMLLLRAHWDRLTAGVLFVVGLVVLLLGYRGVSDTAYPAEQFPYLISAGVGGVILLGASATLWLSADLRDEWRVLNQLNVNLLQLAESMEGESNQRTPTTGFPEPDNGVKPPATAVRAGAQRSRPLTPTS